MAGIRASLILAVATSLALAAPGCSRPAAPTQPVAQPQPGLPTASPVAANPKVGAVFQGATELHTSSGSVLHSGSGNLILTAAHCLAGGTNATFVPGFAGNYVPANAWAWTTSRGVPDSSHRVAAEWRNMCGRRLNPIDSESRSKSFLALW